MGYGFSVIVSGPEFIRVIVVFHARTELTDCVGNGEAVRNDSTTLCKIGPLSIMKLKQTFKPVYYFFTSIPEFCVGAYTYLLPCSLLVVLWLCLVQLNNNERIALTVVAVEGSYRISVSLSVRSDHHKSQMYKKKNTSHNNKTSRCTGTVEFF